MLGDTCEYGSSVTPGLRFPSSSLRRFAGPPCLSSRVWSARHRQVSRAADERCKCGRIAVWQPARSGWFAPSVPMIQRAAPAGSVRPAIGPYGVSISAKTTEPPLLSAALIAAVMSATPT